MTVVVDTQMRVWLNDCADPSDCIGLDVNVISEQDYTQTISSGTYGNTPVYRMRTQPGVQRGAKIQLANRSDSDMRWLVNHLGRTVWYRDPRFAKFSSFYTFDNGMVPSPDRWANRWGVSLSFTEITVNDLL